MKKLFTLMMLLMTIVIGAKASTVDDLATISADYTFIADNVTTNGTSKLSANTLYDSNRIFTSTGNSVAANKGESTFGGANHLNSLRIKNTQDVLAFKVSKNCTITFYTQSHDKRGLQVGSTNGGTEYGSQTVSTNKYEAIVNAGVVYLSSFGGDLYIAGFEIVFPAGEDAPGNPVFDPEAGEVPAETAVTISSTGAATILYQWGATAIGQTGDWTGAATYSADNKPVVPAVGSANNVLSVKASNTNGDTYGSATYTITNPVVANPVLPATGSFNDSKSIEITCATSGATIQYSFDNSTWNNYTEAFSITSTTTVYAKATKTDYVDSEVVSATYTKLDPGTDGNVDDLTAVSAGYTFIADDVTGGVSRIKPGNKLYGDGKIYINGVANSKTDKGSSTIGGVSYYNSINLNNGYVAFKTDGPVKVKIYGGNNGNRNFIVGTADDDDKYGEAPTGQIAWTVFIPEAATVYIKQKNTSSSGDYCLAGLEVSDAETVTLNAKGFATYSSSYDFEYFGADAYGMELTATSLSGTKVTTGKIKAGEGILFKGEAGAKVYIVDTTGAAALENNSLIGTTDINNEVISSVGYVNKYALNGDTFKKFTGALVANKAFFGTNEPISSNSLDLVFDGATAINNVNANDNANSVAPVKVIKNGQLYIGNYNVAGARIK